MGEIVDIAFYRLPTESLRIHLI